MSAALAEDVLLAALDATWKAAEMREDGPWLLRRGDGGGKRVSCATAIAIGAELEIEAAEAGMRALHQPPLFMLGSWQRDLDEALERRGYLVLDPTVIYAAPAARLAKFRPEGIGTIRGARPLARMREIWAEAGIGPGRLAVMARSGEARVYVLGRIGDRPRACAFAAVSEGIAMLHALEVTPEARRHGLGRDIVGTTADWAVLQRAHTLAMAVTEANAPARALYEGLGALAAARYHYRVLPEEAS